MYKLKYLYQTAQGMKGALITKYQPNGERGTRPPPATPHRLQNPKWPPGGPKMADGVWKDFWAF